MTSRAVYLGFILGLPLSAIEMTGKVVDSSTGKPIPKANVSAGIVDEIRVQVFTDSEGNFTIRNLKPGAYHLYANALGYVSKLYNSIAPELNGRPLMVDEEIATTPIVLRLTPTSIISGRIIDEDGDPVEWVTVYAFRETRRENTTKLAEPIAAQADTEGNYRIADLPPGNYRLFARGGRLLPGRPKQFHPTWFPGVDSFPASRLVQIRIGDNLSSANIQMGSKPLYKLKGRLIAPSGDEAKMYSIRLVPKGITAKLMDIANPEIRFRGSTGEFEAGSVPAGDYTLQAIREDMHTREVALRLDLSIFSDQEDILLGPRPLTAIAGRIEMAPGAPPLEVETLKVTIASTDKEFAASVRPISVREDGSFEVYNLSVSKYRLSVHSAEGKELILANPDIDLNAPIQSPLNLRVLAHGPSVLVQAANRNASFVTTLDGGFANLTEAAQARLFLAPGRHTILTFEDIDVSRFEDPEFVARLKPLAHVIDIKPGDNIVVEVPTITFDQLGKLNHPL